METHCQVVEKFPLIKIMFVINNNNDNNNSFVILNVFSIKIIVKSNYGEWLLKSIA